MEWWNEDERVVDGRLRVKPKNEIKFGGQSAISLKWGLFNGNNFQWGRTTPHPKIGNNFQWGRTPPLHPNKKNKLKSLDLHTSITIGYQY